jgi:hypothetical protein
MQMTSEILANILSLLLNHYQSALQLSLERVFIIMSFNFTGRQLVLVNAFVSL